MSEHPNVQQFNQKSVQIINETAKLNGDTTMAATDTATLITGTAVQPIAKKSMLTRQQQVSSDKDETDVGSHQAASNNPITIANVNENLEISQDTSADYTNQTEQKNRITFSEPGRERRFASLVNALFKA